VRDAILSASVVIIAPSNPIVSLGPLLAVPAVRDVLRETRAKVAGVSPIVAGKTIKGPADRMMASLGMTPSAVGVAEAYSDFLDVLVIDEQDAHLESAVEATGVRAVIAQTIMRGPAEKRALAQAVLGAVQ
jgi:LPPG:FO 2-phospho-L-lactate transferase